MSAVIIALVTIPVIIAEDQPPITAASITAASITEDVARAAQGRSGVRALTSEELFVAANTELLKSVRGCGADETCLAERLEAVRAELGAIVLVNLLAEPPIVAVRLFDVRGKKVISSAIGPLVPPETTISSAIEARVARLLDALGHRLEGRLVVQPSPNDARVEVEGALAATNTFALAPGRYVVRVSKDGYGLEELAVEVHAGNELVLLPVLEANAAWFESPWVWVSVGAALVIGGSIIAIVANQPPDCVCIGPPELCPPC